MSVATASAVEIAQVAGEIEFIAGTAFTMIGITLLVRPGEGCMRIGQWGLILQRRDFLPLADRLVLAVAGPGRWLCPAAR
jgi:hypothetical protein